MVTSKLFSLKPKTKNIINYTLYGGFFLYIVSLMLSSKSIASTIPYAIILIIFGGFTLLNEYLLKIYKNSIKTLTTDCDPKAALTLMKRLNKLDIFKVYKKSSTIFNLLALRDLGMYDDLEIVLREIDSKDLKKSPDLLLIYYYSFFLSSVAKNDHTNVESYYKKLIDLKDNGIKNMKANPLISWNELTGTYYLYMKDYKTCKKSYKKVHMNQMNNREKAHFLMNMAKLELAQKNIDDSKYYLNKLSTISNKMFLSTEAKNL